MKSSYRLLVFAILLIAISVVGYSTPTITEKTEIKFDVQQMDVSLENVVVNDLFVLSAEFILSAELEKSEKSCFIQAKEKESSKIDNQIITQRELSLFYIKKSIRINKLTYRFKWADNQFTKSYIEELNNLYPRNILNNSSGGISEVTQD